MVLICSNSAWARAHWRSGLKGVMVYLAHVGASSIATSERMSLSLGFRPPFFCYFCHHRRLLLCSRVKTSTEVGSESVKYIVEEGLIGHLPAGLSDLSAGPTM